MTPDEYHAILTALTEVEHLFEKSSATWTPDDHELYRAVRVIRCEVLKRESGHPFPSVPLALVTQRALAPLTSAAPVVTTGPLTEGSERRIRVLVVDDEAGVRAVVGLLIGSAKDMEVIGEAKNGQEAIDMAAAQQPDVIIMDVNMPVLNGLDATRTIVQSRPVSKVVLFTANRAITCVEQAAAAGAVGAIFKPAGRDQILNVIRQAHAGNRHLGELRSVASTSR